MQNALSPAGKTFARLFAKKIVVHPRMCRSVGFYPSPKLQFDYIESVTIRLFSRRPNYKMSAFPETYGACKCDPGKQFSSLRWQPRCGWQQCLRTQARIPPTTP